MDTNLSWDWFYIHEWQMHGNCYMMNLLDKSRKNYLEWEQDKDAFEKQTMDNYYRHNIERAKEFNFQASKTRYENLEEFAEEIGFKGKETHFYLNLLYDKDTNEYWVYELKICYGLSSIPGGEVTIPCTYRSDFGNPPFNLRNPFVFPGTGKTEL